MKVLEWYIKVDKNFTKKEEFDSYLLLVLQPVSVLTLLTSTHDEKIIKKIKTSETVKLPKKQTKLIILIYISANYIETGIATEV